MRLNDRLDVRPWRYVAISKGGEHLLRIPRYMNEHLTGGVTGDQKPARINFRMALWIVHGWNQLGEMRYHLVLPNPGE